MRARGFAPGLGIACALLAVAGCAHMEPPPGGPEDKTPPEVAAVYPAPDAVNVPRDARLVFQFTEWIDRKSLRGQVMLSPPLPGRLRAEADGDRLVVEMPAGRRLREGATYTAAVLGGLKDLRGNALPRPFTLRFATGPALDSASVAGRIVAEARRGNAVAALYAAGDRARVEALSPRDTGFRPAARPEPWRELPAYLAAADTTGAFRADAAAEGDYALFAFEDVNGNLAFDVGLEPAATGEPSLSLRPAAPEQTLRLTALDTLPLRIAEAVFEAEGPADTAEGAQPPELLPGVVVVKFTRAPHPARAADASIYLVLPDSGAPVAATGAAWSPAREAWLLEVPPLRAGMRHRVALRARPDFPGREGAQEPDTSVSFEVEPESKDETWTLAPSAPAGPSGLPAAGSLRAGSAQAFTSNLPLSGDRWDTLAARLEARLERDSSYVPMRPRRTGLLTLAVDLPRPLRAGGALELRLRPQGEDSVPRSLYSGKVPDSSSTGTLSLEPPARLRGWTFWASPATGTRREEVLLSSDGGNRLAASLAPGIWRVQAFLDRDGDGAWHPGALRPWIAQEPYALVADKVTVTAGDTTKVTAEP